jgi:hypothetical protein
MTVQQCHKLPFPRKNTQLGSSKLMGQQIAFKGLWTINDNLILKKYDSWNIPRFVVFSFMGKSSRISHCCVLGKKKNQ